MKATKMSRQITQAEIARLAGVSQATVSLVLNSRSRDARVSPETEARVRTVIEKWGYVPNAAARSLVGGRNAIVGVFTFEPAFPTDQGDFYWPFLAGIEQEAELSGRDLLMFTSAGPARRIFTGAQTRLSLADGSLLLGRDPDLDGIRGLIDLGHPFVYIGHREVGSLPLSYVAADYAQATEAHVQLLTELGHHRIAYVRTGQGANLPSRDRIEGFRRAVTAAGITQSASPVWEAASLTDAAALLDAADELGITAIVAEQQVLAEQIDHAATARGVSVPADLSLSVLGDVIGAAITARGWSGYSVAGHEMGSAALSLLNQIIEDNDHTPRHLLVPCTPIDGVTVAAAPIGAAR